MCERVSVCVCQDKVSSLETSLVTVVKEFDEERERQASHAQSLLRETRYSLPTQYITHLTIIIPYYTVRKQNISVAVPTVGHQSWLMFVAWGVGSCSKGQRLNTSCWMLCST